MSSRAAVPFHCPFCGDGNLWPHEGEQVGGVEHKDAWECRSCLRAFSLTMIGQLPRPAVGSAAGPEGDS